MSLEKLRLHRAQTDAAFLADTLVDPDVEALLLAKPGKLSMVASILREALGMVETALSAGVQRSGATDGAVEPAQPGGKFEELKALEAALRPKEPARKPSPRGCQLPIPAGPFAGLRYRNKVTCEGCGRRDYVRAAIKEDPPWPLADLCGGCAKAAEPDQVPKRPPIVSAREREVSIAREILNQVHRSQAVKPVDIVQVSPNGVQVVAHAYQTAKEGGEELEVPNYAVLEGGERAGPKHHHPKLSPKNTWRAKKEHEAARKC